MVRRRIGGRVDKIAYLGRLLGEVFKLAWKMKAWWLVPLVIILLALAALVATSQIVTPFAYTMF